ncbi:MAG: hypothetical protein ABIM99_02635 [Candidatus Dojkabacteria bacterium]
MKKTMLVILLLLVIPISTFALSEIDESRGVTTPVSVPVSYSIETELVIPQLSSVYKLENYSGNFYSKNSFTLKFNDSEIDLVPINIQTETNTASLLNEFILENHGVAEILNQKDFKIGDRTITLRTYNLYENEYEIFASIILNKTLWIVHTVINSENLDKSDVYNLYLKIVKEFKTNHNLKKKYESLNINKVPKEMRDLNIRINSKFNLSI